MRAFSTLCLRYDSELKEVCFGPGVPGLQGDASQPVAEGFASKLTGLMNSFSFGDTRPAKALFIADGMPHQRVTDALVANEPDKVSVIVMIFERPLGESLATT